MSRTETIAAHVVALTKAVLEGDAAALLLIGEAVGQLEGAAWDALLIDTVNGKNALQEFIATVIEDEAKKRAEAEREPAKARRSPTIEHRAELAAWRGFCAMEPGYS